MKTRTAAVVAMSIAVGCGVEMATAFGIIGRDVVNDPSGRSMPPGRYEFMRTASPTEPPVLGDVVVIGNARRYGFTVQRVIKRVACPPNSIYCWHSDTGRHDCDGRPLQPPTEHARALGLKPWPHCRRLGEDEFAGFGMDHADYSSADSRYREVGTFRLDDVLGIYAEPSD